MDLFTSNLDALHHVQREVLRKLTYSPFVLSHAALLPEGMAGNSFNYHLRTLIRQKLIQKNEEGYLLTPLGRLVIDSMSLDDKRFKLRPSVGIMLIIKSGRKTLLYKSSRQPMPGFVALPYGKLRISQTFFETAERIIKRRGIDPRAIKDLEFREPFNLRYYQGEQLVAHRVGEIWTANYSGTLSDFQTENGQTFWSDQLVESKELDLLTSTGLHDARIDI
ncbi:hypothetical protein KC878_01520 [Candidatus Saccharibacteria bacterium]|nr:hypothetical protein [Candidatus Saccharibacteria bacterium]MCB9821205.1 hypothetical protein [Candidatus Nomurabacteria bacterium]